MRQSTLAVWLLLAILLVWVPTLQRRAAAAGAFHPLTVRQAVGLCAQHPASRETLAVRGYLVGTASGFGFTEGYLVRNRLVQIRSTAEWIRHRSWKRLGAIRVQILENNPARHHVIANAWLTIHGALTCQTQTLRNDLDPFPFASPTPTATATPVPSGSYHRLLSSRDIRLICHAHPAKVYRLVARGVYVFRVLPFGSPPGYLYDHVVTVPDGGSPPPDEGQVFVYTGRGVPYLPWQGTWIVLHGVLHCDPRGIFVLMESWHLTDAPSPAPQPTVTATPRPITAPTSIKRTANKDGIELTLTVPGTAFPRNALVPIMVGVHNNSGTDVRLDVPCYNRNPGSSVSGTTGAENYIPPVLHPDCVPAHRRLLKKHAMVTSTHYLILRGPVISGSVSVWAPASAFWPHYIEVHTAPIRLQIYPGVTPLLTLVRQPRLHATLPANGTTYLYMDAWRCPDNRTGGHPRWTPTAIRVQPGCAHPVSWNVVVGMPGQPVAYLDY